MIAKTPEDFANLRTAGKALKEVLQELRSMVTPGLKTSELDIRAESEIRKRGAVPAFLGYKPEGSEYPFPAVLCLSINDEIVHGIPSEEKVIEAGDIVSLDLGLAYKGYFVDSAITMIVGEADAQAEKLLIATSEALEAAIEVARVGNHIGDIGAAVERIAKKYGFAVVEELGGHGVGKAVHEKPFIPNAGKEGTGGVLTENLVIAIEPMFAEGSAKIVLADDEWTYLTEDGKRAAHFEHTILITKNGPEVLTA